MPDHAVASVHDVGQALTAEDLGEQIAGLMRQAADATRIAVEVRQQGVQAADDSRGGSRVQGQAYVEFAGFQSRTDAYDVLHLDSEPAAEILATHRKCGCK